MSPTRSKTWLTPPAPQPPRAPAASYDYIVVGGGTAGVVTAVRLAEAEPSRRVALIEAGPTDADKPRVRRAATWMELLFSDLDYDYRIEPQPRGNSAMRHSRGRVLGGCSSHNSCIAFRALDRDLDEWSALGASGWNAAACAPHYERVLSRVNVAEQPVDNPFYDDVLDACAAVGLPRVSFGGGALAPGAGRFQLNVESGERQSSSVAYLHRGQVPDNLALITDTPVYRVWFEERAAVGVVTAAGALAATEEVILCAGAFDTPRLLMLSGVGPGEHLAEHGIEAIVDRPGVGENLSDHPEGVIMWESSAPLPPASTQGWELGVFARVDPGDGTPDLMFHVGMMPFDMNTRPWGYPTAAHGFSLTPNVPRAKSRGTVRLRSNHPADDPRIDFRYFTDEEGYDERILVEGLLLARDIVGAEPLSPWVSRELAPGAAVTGRAELSAFVRATANTVYHPMGTARMGGAGDPMAVVDPALRVIGAERLRVADASIFPAPVSVNPAITCMMIGERAADFVMRGA